MTDLPGMAVQYALPDSLPEWELPEVPVPESPEHDECADYVRSVLSAWLKRRALPGVVKRNLAIRWDPLNPKVGVDPDVCWVDAVPPGWEDGEVDSLRLWMGGHQVPPLAVEVVSKRHPYKDYRRVQDKYAVVGTREVWVYDQRKAGPRLHGGPHLLQVWARTPSGVLVRRHFSDAPARSEILNAWLVPRFGRPLLIADDSAGDRPWPSLEEQAREEAFAETRKERERADLEQRRADLEQRRAEAAEAELARLRAELRK